MYISIWTEISRRPEIIVFSHSNVIFGYGPKHAPDMVGDATPETRMMPERIDIPSDMPPPRCKCGNVAVGIYKWETKSFGRLLPRAATMCAACALDIDRKISMYTPRDQADPVFYRANTPAKLVTTFNYPPSTLEPVKSTRQFPHGRRLVHQFGGDEIITTRPPRGWCPKCNMVRDVILSRTKIQHTRRSGETYVKDHIKAECEVCGTPTQRMEEK